MDIGYCAGRRSEWGEGCAGVWAGVARGCRCRVGCVVVMRRVYRPAGDGVVVCEIADGHGVVVVVTKVDGGGGFGVCRWVVGGV